MGLIMTGGLVKAVMSQCSWRDEQYVGTGGGSDHSRRNFLLSGPESNLWVTWGFLSFGIIRRRLQDRAALRLFLGTPCTQRLSQGTF